MAEPEKQYEYGRTPEETAPGLKGFFNILRGPVVDAFTPERREVITAPETTYEMVSDGRYRPKITPGEYGPVEKDLEYMPVVQAARGALDFAGKFATDGKVREETGAAIAKGIGQIFKDYQEGLTYGYRSGTDEMSFYDPVEKRVVEPDVLLPLFTGATGALFAPVKGPGMVAGMFAGPKAANADLDALKTAEKMELKGHSRDEIFDQTNWFRFQDREGKPMGKWMFEIGDDLSSMPDRGSAALKPYLTTTGNIKTKSGKTGKGPEIDKLLVHDELFQKAYPGALMTGVLTNVAEDILKVREATKKLQVEYGRGNLTEPQFRQQYNTLLEQNNQLQDLLKKGLPDPAKTVQEDFPLIERALGDTVVETSRTGGRNQLGYYSPGKNTFGIRTDRGRNQFRSTALHELMHAIQQREGFQQGGNKSEFGRYSGIDLPIDPKTGKKRTPYQMYRDLVGEAQARLVQSRRDMNPTQRSNIRPYQDPDFDESRLYTREELGLSTDRGLGPMTSAENLMKFSPRTTELKLNDVFRSDIPKESWLEEKVKYVKSRGKDPRGFNFTGVDTGNFKDDFIPKIPVSELVKLKGRNKEQENVRKESLASLIEVMGRTGKLPLIGEAFPTNKGQYGADKEYRPFIIVDYEGIPTVSEGNHRIMAAAALGMKDLPVEIRYFDGGERKATGAFKPENILKNSVKVSPDD